MNSSNIQEVLKKNWGFDKFRPLQEDIIQSILNGNDTLALLPTGGGKSICFQVPALANEGICIVISPLIALMKDQVFHLQQKGIKAISITAGIGKRELDILLDNCVYGNIKFLYLSPERLQQDLVKERIKKMNVNLIAVDEAHCISQWGYDFRPPYLQIASLRTMLPGIPILALTATATPKVRIDIIEKLALYNSQVFVKSFERKNLNYLVIEEQNKLNRLLKILEKVKGSSVVYVRNRMQTKEISDFLNQHKISSDFYHAGLTMDSRSLKQENWIKNKSRVIVSTNAFGMGIDKPDVRCVVHLDLPDSLEAYYQEAGRAGRDEQKAYAVLLCSEVDRIDLKKKYLDEFPTLKEVKELYQHLGQHFQLAFGSGENLSLDFDLALFCKNFSLSVYKTIQGLKFLERDGLISLSDEVFLPSRLMFKINQTDLYTYQVANPSMDTFIKLLLRSYGGVFDHYVKISERELAKRHETTIEKIKNLLLNLNNQGILDYEQAKNLPQVQFLNGRFPNTHIQIDHKHIKERWKNLNEKIDGIIHYSTEQKICRSKLLLSYFGELDSLDCGICDVCLARKRGTFKDSERETLFLKILEIVSKESVSLPELIKKLAPLTENKSLNIIRLCIDEGFIQLNDQNQVIKVR